MPYRLDWTINDDMHTAGRVLCIVKIRTQPPDGDLCRPTNVFRSPLTLTPSLTLNSNPNQFKMRVIDHTADRMYRHFGLD